MPRGKQPSAQRRLTWALLISFGFSLCAALGGTTGVRAELKVVPSKVLEFQPRLRWSGRVNSIALHPKRQDHAIISTETGGLFKTEDGGKTWTHLDGLLAPETQDVAYLPGHPNVVIATTARDYQIIPVTPALNGNPGPIVSGRPGPGPGISLGPGVVDPVRTTVGTVPLLTSGGGIWISKDGGVTWSRPVSAVPRAVKKFTKPDRCPVKYSAYKIAIEPGTEKIYVASDCGVSISTDLGKTWTHVEMPAHPRPAFDRRDYLAVAALGGGKVLVGGFAGVLWSEDGGKSWKWEPQTLSGVGGMHALAASRPGEAFVVNQYGRLYQMTTSSTQQRSWTQIRSAPPGRLRCGGIPYVKAFAAEKATRFAGIFSFRTQGVDLYYGDKCAAYNVIGWDDPIAGRTAFPSTWTKLAAQHADARDLAFRVSETREEEFGEWTAATPVMMANDGGLELSADGGRTWKTVGSGPKGINALQITEITGQRIDRTSANGRSRYDLMFGTWDNSLWSSFDTGVTWTTSVCCEGFSIEAERRVPKEADARVTFMACMECKSLISGPGFKKPKQWKDPAAGEGPPTLVSRGIYIQPYYFDPVWAKKNNDKSPQGIRITRDFGKSWKQIADVPGDLSGPLRVAGSGRTQTAYGLLGVGTESRPHLEETSLIDRTHLFRMTEFSVGSRAKVKYPAMKGFGSLGAQPLSGIMGRGLAVDPQDPMHLLAADVINERMVESQDGGENWKPRPDLTRLFTHKGAFAFVGHGPFGTFMPLVSSIVFHPDYPKLILIGTRQGGIFFSSDRGRTWALVPGSEQVINVTDFHWVSLNEAVVATYGRGIWKIQFSIEVKGRISADSFPGSRFVAERCQQSCDVVSFAGSGSQTRYALEEFVAAQGPNVEAGLLVLEGDLPFLREGNGHPSSKHVGAGASYVFFGDDATQFDALKAIADPDQETQPERERDLDERIAALDLPPDERIVGLTRTGGDWSGAIVASKELAVPRPGAEFEFQDTGSDESPLVDKPYIVLSAAKMAAGMALLERESTTLTVRGQGFSPGRALLFELMGHSLDAEPVETRDDGSFLVELDLHLAKGFYQLIVRQDLEDGQTLTDAARFFVMNNDDERTFLDGGGG